MGIPSVSVKKSAVGAAPAIQSNQGILLVVGSSSSDTTSGLPTMFSNQGAVTGAYSLGPLPEYLVYNIDVSGRPSLGLHVTPSVAGSYGSITKTGTGTYTVVAGGTAPYEHYAVQVNFLTGGTLGTTGITYTYSLDGGNSVSAVQALGTATSIAIPNSNVSFTLSTSGSSTVVAGDSFVCFTERPLMNNTDLTAAFTAINTTRQPWEIVLFDCEYLSGTVGAIDTWLAGREANGQFNIAVINTRFLLEPTPGAEAPGTYAAAMTTLTENDASNRICVGADGGHNTSLITGLFLKRPTALALAAMTCSVTPNIGTDPSEVDLGPVPNFQIDNGSNPNDWDEGVYQMLDSQRLVTLRSFAPGGPQGAYITNPNVLAPTGSSIIWIQLLRVLNAAASVSWSTLNTQLSKGVDTVISSTLGFPVIDPRDAQKIERFVNGPLNQALAGQDTAAQFRLNRDDNLSTPNAPVKGQTSIVGKFYLKNIQVTVALVKSISAPLGGA